MVGFIFKGDFDLGSVSLDLTVADNQVLIHDFRYAQLAQMFCSLLNGVLSSVFPAHGTGANQFDNIVCAYSRIARAGLQL